MMKGTTIKGRCRNLRLGAIASLVGLTSLLGAGAFGLGNVSADASTTGQITTSWVVTGTALDVTVAGSGFAWGQVERVAIYDQSGNTWASASVMTSLGITLCHGLDGGCHLTPGGTFTVMFTIQFGCGSSPAFSVETGTPETISMPGRVPVTVYPVDSNVDSIPASAISPC